MTASSSITFRNRVDHLMARMGYRRSRHRVEPGLYTLGEVGPDAPVLVSANYTLSFDALRSSLVGISAYILVLDTDGVNVWCAAGKGTFGTDELVRRIDDSHLADVVSHRRLILPQLGAPGVSADEVERRTGFRAEFGPVRASDLPEYLRTGKASEEMRKVEFGMAARVVLIPVEIVHIFLPVLAVVVVLRLTGVTLHLYNEATAGVLGGLVLLPVLLPWLPTRDFSTKGFLVGALAAVPLLIRQFTGTESAWWRNLGVAVAVLLIAASISAFLSLNFTGSSTYTSRTGVRREMFRYIPTIASSFGIGIVLRIVFMLV